jgi:dihydroflavonol-4-reductase
MGPRSESTVVVTGGSGFTGSHLIVRLLDDGYVVRTTVRSPSREAQVREAVTAGGHDPDCVEVAIADLASDDGWDRVMDGARYVHHVATPMPTGSPTDPDALVGPARDGVLRVLASARFAGVERVVMTSSDSTITHAAGHHDVYTEADWSDLSSPSAGPYVRSKTLAELAAWDDVRAAGGPEFSVLNPVRIYGPVLTREISSTPWMIAMIIAGRVPVLPPSRSCVVDVRDLADLHVRAMLDPRAIGERFLAGAHELVSLLDVARILSESLGDAGSRLPTRELSREELFAAADEDPILRELARYIDHVPAIDNTKARTLLDWEPRDLRETIVDMGLSLVAHSESGSASGELDSTS